MLGLVVRLVLGLGILLTATLPASTLPAQALPASSVVGDDYRDVFVGTGGLILPRSVGDSTRNRVASCLGCSWRLTKPCATVDDGNAFDGSEVCQSVSRGCPQAQRTFRSWFAPEVGRWEDVGIVCMGDPVTVRDLGARAHDQLIRAVPAQDVTSQPVDGVITQLPLVVQSGQGPGRLEFTMSLADTSAQVVAAATWRWDFGDGFVLTTDHPGCTWPCDRLAHAYRRPGTYRVTTVTTWRGSFTVDGMGPYEVTEPVVQSVAMDVEVSQGRALLTPGTYGTMKG